MHKQMHHTLKEKVDIKKRHMTPLNVLHGTIDAYKEPLFLRVCWLIFSIQLQWMRTVAFKL